MLIALLLSWHAYGQRIGKYGISGGVDGQMGVKNGSFNPSISYFELIGIGKRKSIFIGWTGRLSAFYGNNLDYITAPARLTRGEGSLRSIGKPLLIDNIDTLHDGHTAHTSLNLGIRLEYYVGRVTLGASVDLLGFTFLRHSQTDYLSSSTGLFMAVDSLGRTLPKPYQGVNAYQSATPQRFNIRLLGDNNRGMLTTELYLRCQLSKEIGLKANYQWVTTELFIGNKDIVSNNNRFRNRITMLSIGITALIDPW